MVAPAVVTGAAGGLGRALTRRLAAQGRTVYAVDVAAASDVDSDRVRPVAADVTDAAAMHDLARTAADARFICLNAGIVGADLGAPWEASAQDWQRVLDVNLLGVVNGLRAFVPSLLHGGEAAHLLITASLAGLVTFPTGGAYAATKHAVVAVAEQTALALADTAVGVTVLCPALVRSGMSDQGADPDDVAAAGLAACERGVFAVVDDEWTSAVADRAARLSQGLPPVMPGPTPG